MTGKNIKKFFAGVFVSSESPLTETGSWRSFARITYEGIMIHRKGLAKQIGEYLELPKRMVYLQ